VLISLHSAPKPKPKSNFGWFFVRNMKGLENTIRSTAKLLGKCSKWLILCGMFNGWINALMSIQLIFGRVSDWIEFYMPNWSFLKAKHFCGSHCLTKKSGSFIMYVSWFLSFSCFVSFFKNPSFRFCSFWLHFFCVVNCTSKTTCEMRGRTASVKQAAGVCGIDACAETDDAEVSLWWFAHVHTPWLMLEIRLTSVTGRGDAANWKKQLAVLLWLIK